VIDRILQVAKASGAEAIHPGYGFLSENEDFAAACAAAGVGFIGPSPTVLREMGDKVRARARMAAAGVPVMPGSDGAVGSPAEAEAIARRVGFPVMIKAAAGGGGKGIRIVRDAKELKDALERARSEALASFGDGAVYVEKFLENPRHVEIQVLGDRHGNVIHLGERECSVQRRHQKIIEESPSPAVSADLRRRMGEAAVRAAREVGYESAGTVEFLLDANADFRFLEMNTRLQVEHPVTEQVTGIDLVRAQLRIAAGEPLDMRQEDVVHRGHAIEARICAEDPDRGFAPCIGTIQHLDLPGGGRVRIDAGLFEGMEVGVHYDSMLAKLIVWGSDRDRAMARLRRALGEFQITGVTTNIPYLLRVLDAPEFVSGKYDTGLLERNAGTLRQAPTEDEARTVAMLAAAIARDLRLRRSLHAGHAGHPGAPDGVSAWLAAARREGLRPR
jgi:acetyl-CoA carboxylase biotin carboxylase subunit